VLATALQGQAQAILTGDKDLLVLQEFRHSRILSPRQFVEWMDLSS
jgi:predicted nucleic acid-binding protein